MNSNWVKINRSLLKSDIWLQEPFTRGQAWVDLVLSANHSEGFIRARGVKIIVKRGQVGVSQVTLAERWKWSRGKVKRFLDELESDKQIEQQKNNVSSLISITNYSKYQDGDTADEQQTEQQTGSKRSSKRYTNKNNKKEKEGKEEIIKPTLEDFISYAEEFSELHKKDKTNCINQVRLAYQAYSDNGWKDAHDNQIKNWKSKLSNGYLKLDKLANKRDPNKMNFSNPLI